MPEPQTPNPETNPLKTKILYRLLHYSGLPWLFRELLQRRRTTILLWHDIDRQTATRVFTYLRDRYHIIALADFLSACQEKRTLPPKSIVFTFDDGHIRNYELLSVVQALQIPITIFLCAGIINTKRRFWFQHPPVQATKEQMKQVTNTERLRQLEALGFFPEREYESATALQATHIAAMKAHFDFQAHTMFHPCLPNCTDAEARETLQTSKELLEEEFGLTIYALAYPNGDYSERDIAIAKSLNYQCAVTVEPGYNTNQSDLFRLKRIDVSDSADLHEVAVKASGVWAFLKRLLGKHKS